MSHSAHSAHTIRALCVVLAVVTLGLAGCTSTTVGAPYTRKDADAVVAALNMGGGVNVTQITGSDSGSEQSTVNGSVPAECADLGLLGIAPYRASQVTHLNDYALRGGVNGAGSRHGVAWMMLRVFVSPKAAAAYAAAITSEVTSCSTVKRGDGDREYFGRPSTQTTGGWQILTLSVGADSSLDDALSKSVLVKQNLVLVVDSSDATSVGQYVATVANSALSK